MLFNDILTHSDVTPSATTFRVLTTGGGDVPPSTFAVEDPNTVYNDAIAELMDAAVAKLRRRIQPAYGIRPDVYARLPSEEGLYQCRNKLDGDHV